MGYVERSLGGDEAIVYRADFHWSKYLAAFLPLAVGVVLTIIFAVFLVTSFWWLPLVFVVIGLIGSTAELIPIYATQMAVTTQRLVYKTGVFRRATEELGLRTVEEVNLIQSVAGRLFGYGRILAKGTGGGEVFFPDLNDPVQFRSAIEDARRRSIFTNPVETLRSGGTGSG